MASIRFEVKDFIATVTIDRPPVNALNGEVRDEITRAFDAINDMSDVRVAILTGTGNVFCAGADLKDRPSIEDHGAYWRHNRVVRETANSIRECAKPVIAAVNGPAIGAGFGLMCACDIMLASDNVHVAMTEIDVGLAGGAALLHEFFGRSRMRRMMYTGMKLSALELYRLGVIEEALPRERLMPAALEIAQEIANKAPLGIRYAKQSANMATLMPQRDTYRFEQNHTVVLSQTEDSQEARRAFAEKRKPIFQGR